MSKLNRRDWINRGLAGAGALILPAHALATETSGSLGNYASFLQQERQQAPQQAVQGPPLAQAAAPQRWNATEDNILGPFHRTNAPFRAKITPPLEPGETLLINGRVFALDTRRPLAHVVLDIWQANAQGRYDNDDPANQPAANLFVNRARIVTDENGYYEYETIKPAPYRIGPNAWRPSHIHYLVRHTGYQQLITQLYFRGDEHQRTDQFIRPSLIIDLESRRTANGTYKAGTFNVILARMPR